jgi:hypothetical protein
MKVPFEILFLEVEKLYQKQFDPSDTISIEEHCDFIRIFIESCGWTSDEYIRRMFDSKQSN